MKTHIDLIRRSTAYSTARINASSQIQYHLIKRWEIQERQVQLIAKKRDLFRRIDALEAQLQALKIR